MHIFKNVFNLFERQRNRKRNRDCPFSGFVLKCLQQLEQCQTQARSQKLNTGLLCRLIHPSLYLRLYINRKLDSVVEPRLEPRHSDLEGGCPKLCLNYCIKCLSLKFIFWTSIRDCIQDLSFPRVICKDLGSNGLHLGRYSPGGVSWVEETL